MNSEFPKRCYKRYIVWYILYNRQCDNHLDKAGCAFQFLKLEKRITILQEPVQLLIVINLHKYTYNTQTITSKSIVTHFSSRLFSQRRCILLLSVVKSQLIHVVLYKYEHVSDFKYIVYTALYHNEFKNTFI